ncbi:sigma-70 family RNA polymerase sigma factor [Reyranella sp.]|uniref:sigma-70 family RNA polymerase sigma factor n=1 Tax=Reyranella sp. TaxID=1929291 RepID=UPI003BA94D59
MAAPESGLAVFMEHRESLLIYARRLVRDRSGAEDVVQEAWLRFDEASRRQLLGQPLSYLYRIVHNLALDVCRRRAREGRIFPGTDPEAAAEASAGHETSPEAGALYREQLLLLAEALNELPERTRIAFEMHRFAGCKLREIAECLDISVPFAQALVAEALRHCRKRLGWP